MNEAINFLNSLNTNQTGVSANIESTENEGNIPLSIPGVPSDTLLIHGLSYSTPEFILEDELIATKAAFESFNLVKTKEGQSRGFCFVKFFSLKLAINWMRRNSPLIIDGCECRIEYSRPFESGDWNCLVCGGVNYKKREVCYICDKPKGSKAESCVNLGDRDEGQVENNILLVRGVDKSLTAQQKYVPSKVRGSSVKGVMMHRLVLDLLSVKISVYSYPKQIATTILMNYPKKPSKSHLKETLVSYCAKSSFIPVKKTADYIAFSIKFENEEYFRYWDEATWCDPFPEPSFKVLKPQTLLTDFKSKSDQIAQDTSAINPKLLSQITKWNAAGQQSDQEIFKKIPTTAEINKEYIDGVNNLCLLCNRRFEEVFELQRHVSLSKLHVHFLMHLKRELFENLKNQFKTINSEKVSDWKNSKVVFPTRFGIKSDNKGNQIMRKMGWIRGRGIGKYGDGITKAIRPEKRIKNSGLGTQQDKKRKYS